MSYVPSRLFELLHPTPFSEIEAFGPRGTGGGEAWRKRLIDVSATPVSWPHRRS